MKYKDYAKFKAGNLVTVTSFSANQVIKVDVWGNTKGVNCPTGAPLSGMVVRIHIGPHWEGWCNSLDILVDETIFRFYVTDNLRIELQEAKE